MKTRALFLALPVVAAVGCTTDNRASLEVQAVCSTTTDCVFQATCTNTLMGEPAVDLAQTGVVWAPIQVANQLPDNSDRARGRVNTNDAHVDGIVLEYKNGGLAKITLPTNQLVPASGTTVIGVTLLPPSANAQTTLAAFASTPRQVPLAIDVRLRGYLDDGTRFETGSFPVTVDVCTGCIPSCATLSPGTVLTCPPGNEFQFPRTCK